MALYNFAKASASREEITNTLDAVQKDMLKLLTEGEDAGTAKFRAATQWRYKAAKLVREAVVDEFRMTDPTPIFLERRTLANGDTYEFESLTNTLRVVEFSPMAEPLVFTPRKQSYKIGTSAQEMAWGIELPKIINGQWTIQQVASMASAALTRHYVDLTLGGINVACATGVNDVKGRAVRSVEAGAALTANSVNPALKRMYSLGLTGLTIFGSRWALDALFEIGATTENLKNELNARGQIGTYRGAKMVEINDEYNLFYDAFTSITGATAGQTKALEKLVFVAGNRPGGILLERDLSALDWEEMDKRGAFWSQGVRMEHSAFIHTPGNLHVIQIDG